MAFSLNKVLLGGNLTRDPETKFLANENCVANFGLATNRKYKKDGETVEEVTFLDCEAWGRTAELIGQYLTKGSACFIEGRLKLDQWDDKTTGEKRSKIKIVVDSVQFIGGKPDSVTHPATPQASSVDPAVKRTTVHKTAEVDEDSPPF